MIPNITEIRQEVYKIVETFQVKLQEIQRSQVSLAKNQELLFQQNRKIIESMTLIVKAIENEEEIDESAPTNDVKEV